MWQIYSLLGLLSNAIENSIDKFAIIRAEDIDPMVATFYRSAVYTVIIVIVGLFGWFGQVQMYLDWRLVLFGVIGAATSLSYTYILSKLEITSISALVYISPIVFLLVDVFLIHASISVVQVFGIVLLALGGIGFSIEGNTRRFKKEISATVLCVFIFLIAYGGAEGYLFKYMHSMYDMDATTFFANVGVWATFTLFVLVVVQQKTHLLFTNLAKSYIAKSVASKSCDVGVTLFESQALLLASVSQVSAMTALAPLVLFVVTAVIQGVFKIHLNERLDRVNFIWKGGMIVLLVTGGFLVK